MMPCIVMTGDDPEPTWPRWMTVATCGRYIDRTTSAVQKLVFRGKIPYVRTGDGRITFDRFVIDKWVAGGK